MLVYRIHQMTLWWVPFEPFLLNSLADAIASLPNTYKHKSESVPSSILMSHNRCFRFWLPPCEVSRWDLPA